VTLLSRVLAWFPAFHLTLILLTLAGCVVAPSGWTVLAAAFAVYAVPLGVFRVLGAPFPLEEGVSRLDEPRYSPWWGGHQVQVVFLALPWLEGLLRLVPGLFSLWLRAWGSRVGRAVYWTPQVEIGDRSLLEIGDRVVFGQRVELYSHVVTRKNGRLLLYVKRIRIGSDAFLGAGSRIGPGVRIDDGTDVSVLTHLYPNRHVRSEKENANAGPSSGPADGRAPGAVGASSVGATLRG
jgi:acetyltransferase-like isoleucine patch superfamily enzyme